MEDRLLDSIFSEGVALVDLDRLQIDLYPDETPRDLSSLSQLAERLRTEGKAV